MLIIVHPKILRITNAAQSSIFPSKANPDKAFTTSQLVESSPTHRTVAGVSVVSTRLEMRRTSANRTAVFGQPLSPSQMNGIGDP